MPPHLPAAMASRVQQVPLYGNVGNGHVVVGVGQFPSLLRGRPSGQTGKVMRGGVPPGRGASARH